MRRTRRTPWRTGIAVAILAIAWQSGSSPPDALAQSRARSRDSGSPFSDDWGRWDDFNRTLLQMQRESLSSQEEQNREAGRQLRREELQQERKAASAEREAYFDALLEASRASLRAPQGAYYRKPGWVSADPPGPDTQRITVGGATYLYDRGVFWYPQGSQHIVVTAPLGAVVAEPPPAAYSVATAAGELLYSFGAFYRQREAGFEVVNAAPGTVVSYVPDGYTVEQVQGAAVYRMGESLFKPVFIQGVLLYTVVER